MEDSTLPILINEKFRLQDMEQEHYNRLVNFRPGDKEIVDINPPRFSWPYLPKLVPKGWEVPVGYLFTLQISDREDFQEPVLEVKDTPYNFYNYLPPLPGSGRWYWRIGYNAGTPSEKWSKVRCFTIDSKAEAWDRSALASLNLASKNHPCILFNRDNLEEIRRLKDTCKESMEVARQVRFEADGIIKEDWWINFPKDDKQSDEGGYRYYMMARDLLTVAFAHLIFQDQRYLGFKERLIRMASWPKGGYASPEGAAPIRESREDDTQITEFLGLFFDWFYWDLIESERRILIESLDWRIRHTINNFCWKLDDGKRMTVYSIALVSSSHQYENLMVIAPAALAAYNHSASAREALHLILNYLIGVTNGFGFYEGWNEGPGYGNSKMKWLMDATIYLDTAIREIDLGKNPYLRRIGAFFTCITPVGLQHCSFGDMGSNEDSYLGNNIHNFRKLAYATGEGSFLKFWEESQKRWIDKHGMKCPYFRPWIEYVLPYYYRRPKESFGKEVYSKFFKVAGWVMTNTHSPISYNAYKASVGMVFQCRPRGGYSHSYHSENSFLIHAYGEVITSGAAPTKWDVISRLTMSHNTILVDGLGQNPPRARGFLYPEGCSRYGYIDAWFRRPALVYWVGDATNAYHWNAPYLKCFRRHVLFLRRKYFIIFDDLQVDPDHSPSTFQWLYHIKPEGDLTFNRDAFEFSYRVGENRVKVRHISNLDNLSYEDRQKSEGLINPITGEDYRGEVETIQKRYGGFDLFQHNIWIENHKPAHEFNFMTVIYPYKVGEPEPSIERIDDLTVKVSRGELYDMVSFDVNTRLRPNILIDYKSLHRRNLCRRGANIVY